jgi:hypothetical protein
MDSERRIFSPARRSRRCALTLIACSVLMVIAFVAIHKDRLPVAGNGAVATASDTAPVASKPSTPLKVSMAEGATPQSATQRQ